MFRYPCSYLIYSEAFDRLPEPAKNYVYHRLFEVLSGREQGADFASLSPDSRRAILEILLDTKPGLPSEWTDYAKTNHLQTRSAGTVEHDKPGIATANAVLTEFNRDLQTAARLNE